MLSKQELVTKYGNSKILAISNQYILPLFNEVSTHKNFLVCAEEEVKKIVEQKGEFLLRYELENDTSYKQPIPYVIIHNPKLDKYFFTKRIQGDSRLQGMKSLGIGGHVDENESIEQALYREIAEEIGISEKEIEQLCFQGLILDTSNDVGAVHIGFLYMAKVLVDNLSCKEVDTLTGDYITLAEIQEGVAAGQFETWSEIAYFNCLQKERT